MSLIPLVGTGWTFFHFLTSNATTAAYQRLDLMRNAKRDELQQYLTFARWQAETFRKSNSVRYAVGQYYGFSYGFRLIDPSTSRSQKVLRDMFSVDARDPIDSPSYSEMLRVAPEYANAHRQFHNEFADFIASSEFSNVYLINADQRVVYSVRKDSYLGVDLRSQMATSQLADAVRVVLADPNASATYVSDFVADPVTGEFSALLATRIDIYRKNRGVAVYRLSTEKLAAIVQAQSSNLGQVYLLSQNDLVISAPSGASLTNGTLARPGHETAESGVVQEGLGGGPALSARTDVEFENLTWPLIAEIPTSIAFAGSEFIRNLVIMLSLILVPVMIMVAVVLSGSMTRPLRVLTDEAAAIADGDLDRVVADIRSPSELARLAASFRRMRDAIREQLQLIGEKNRQLENQISVIAEKNLALEEADRLKDTFVANTSHELRTPLNGIIGIAETLTAGAAGALSSTQRSQLQLIVFSARRLSRLVDDLLDLYRIRENRMRLDLQAVDVSSSIHNVLRLADPLLRGAPITLSASLPDGLPPVEVDPLRFEQIIYNLLGNAVKFTEAGAITITANTPSDRLVQIVVSDTGRGIQPDDVERIFKPLERGAAADMLNGPSGTGLGLTIAQHLAEVMGGKLSVTSAPNQGSHFALTLPRSSKNSESSSTDAHQLQQAVGWLNQPEIDHDEPVSDGAPLILVVDDEPINIQVLRNVLQPNGYAVRSATSGREALQFIDGTLPDLIILDVMMPEMDGLDVARLLRARYGLLELPIVMVTARSRTRDVLAGFDAGANDYVTKPFVKDELLARVTMLLEARQSLARGLENSSLRAEIDRRTQVEHALRLSQQRMVRMLDTFDVAVMCFDTQRRVTYANQPGQFLLESAGESPSLVTLLGPPLATSIDDAMRSSGSFQLDQIELGQAGKPLLLSAFELEPEEGGGLAIILAPTTSPYPLGSSQLISTVQSVFDSLPLGALSLSRPQDAPRAAAGDTDEYRSTIVEVVTRSLALWKEASGTGKIDLAEQSGIWRVNLDRSSLQVRTLDKYLLTDSLPQNPRWRDVLKTAEFVLDYVAAHPNGSLATTAIEPLEAALSRLRAILRSRTAEPSSTAP